MVGRLEDASALVAGRTEKAQKERDGMALHIWALTAGWCRWLRAGCRLPAPPSSRLPTPERTGSTYVDARRMFILAEVAARTDDRNVVARDGE